MFSKEYTKTWQWKKDLKAGGRRAVPRDGRAKKINWKINYYFVYLFSPKPTDG
jgi:hypothetical protein